MADTSGLSLELLAVTDARGFLDAFLEALALAREDGDAAITTSDVYEVEELDEDDVVDGIYIKIVDSEGGGEGEGDYVHRIWGVFKGGNTLSHIRVTGYYQSYNGTEYNDDWTLVVPRDVLVTQYFAADGSEDRK